MGNPDIPTSRDTILADASYSFGMTSRIRHLAKGIRFPCSTTQFKPHEQKFAHPCDAKYCVSTSAGRASPALTFWIPAFAGMTEPETGNKFFSRDTAKRRFSPPVSTILSLRPIKNKKNLLIIPIFFSTNYCGDSAAGGDIGKAVSYGWARSKKSFDTDSTDFTVIFDTDTFDRLRTGFHGLTRICFTLRHKKRTGISASSFRTHLNSFVFNLFSHSSLHI